MTDKEREEREKQLIALLLLLFAEYQSRVGTMPVAQLVQAFERDAELRMAPLLASTFEAGAQHVGAQAGVNLAASNAAKQWAGAYASSLASELASTTQSRLAEIGTLAEDQQQEALESLFGEARAESVGITETTRSDTLGQQYGAEDLAERGVELTQVWVTEKDGKVCPFCGQLDGLPEEYWDAVNPEAAGGPPLHPRCLPGDSLVLSRSRITGVSDREFEGELVVIRTASGKQLSATPNHKILTTRGWVAAQFVNPGDRAVCCGSVKAFAATGDVESQEVPARIEDVAKAFQANVGVSAATIPVSAEDFHGDGEGSKVAVVWSDGLLRDRLDASLQEQVEHESFGGGQHSSVLAAAGGVYTSVVGNRDSTNCVMCGRNLPLAGFSSHARPLGELGFGLSSEGNTSGLQDSIDSSAADLELAGQLIDGHAGDVFFDDVIDVGRNPFRDHVYNLETEDGWYVANGIIVHNCRCTVRWVDSQGRRPKPPDETAYLPTRPRGPRPSNPFELQPVATQERPIAVLDLQGNVQGDQPLNLRFTVPGKVNPRHGARRLVTVDVNKLDDAWKDSQPGLYVDNQGKGPAAKEGSFERAQEFLGRAARQDIAVEASVFDLNEKTGGLFASDGRHRFAALRAMGFTEVDIAVPRNQVQAFLERFAPDEFTVPRAKSAMLKAKDGDCGTGAGGFKPGNDCAQSEGGGGSNRVSLGEHPEYVSFSESEPSGAVSLGGVELHIKSPVEASVDDDHDVFDDGSDGTDSAKLEAAYEKANAAVRLENTARAKANAEAAKALKSPAIEAVKEHAAKWAAPLEVDDLPPSAGKMLAKLPKELAKDVQAGMLEDARQSLGMIRDDLRSGATAEDIRDSVESLKSPRVSKIDIRQSFEFGALREFEIGLENKFPPEKSAAIMSRVRDAVNQRLADLGSSDE